MIDNMLNGIEFYEIPMTWVSLRLKGNTITIVI